MDDPRRRRRPDVVRVELRPGARQKLRGGAARARRRARPRNLERVLEQGDLQPPNPDVLLRGDPTLTYRTPLRLGEPYGSRSRTSATELVVDGTARDLTLAIGAPGTWRASSVVFGASGPAAEPYARARQASGKPARSERIP